MPSFVSAAELVLSSTLCIPDHRAVGGSQEGIHSPGFGSRLDPGRVLVYSFPPTNCMILCIKVTKAALGPISKAAGQLAFEATCPVGRLQLQGLLDL